MKKAKRLSRRKYADTLYRALIRTRDRTCRRETEGDCEGPLEVAHVFPRRHLSVRYTPDNGILLCRKHHRWFDDAGRERWDWLISLIGPGRYAALVLEKDTPWHRDYTRVIENLKDLARREG